MHQTGCRQPSILSAVYNCLQCCAALQFEVGFVLAALWSLGCSLTLRLINLCDSLDVSTLVTMAVSCHSFEVSLIELRCCCTEIMSKVVMQCQDKHRCMFLLLDVLLHSSLQALLRLKRSCFVRAC